MDGGSQPPSFSQPPHLRNGQKLSRLWGPPHTTKGLSKRGQENLVPKDMIDVQSFMWVVVKYGPEEVRKAASLAT